MTHSPILGITFGDDQNKWGTQGVFRAIDQPVFKILGVFKITWSIFVIYPVLIIAFVFQLTIAPLKVAKAQSLWINGMKPFTNIWDRFWGNTVVLWTNIWLLFWVPFWFAIQFGVLLPLEIAWFFLWLPIWWLSQ